MADDLNKQFSEHEVELIEKGLARVYRGRLIPIMSGGEPDEDEDQESEESDDDNESEESEGEDEGRESKSFTEDYVKKLRREAAASRKAKAEAERKLKEKEDAELSEADRAKKERDEATAKAEAAEAKADRAIKRASVMAEASAADFHDPGDAFMRLEGEIELDEDGEPSNVAELVKKLAEDRPYLVRGEDDPKRKASPAYPERRKKTSGLTREKLKTMTPQQIAALPQEEVDAALAAA